MVIKLSVAVAVVQHLMVGDLCLEKQLASRIGLGSLPGMNRLGTMDNLLTYLLLFILIFNYIGYLSFKNRYFYNFICD
jgi:hypothetical protein